MAEYTNSPLVDYTCLSPNHSGQRTHSIDRITPHMVVGQCTVEALGNVFLPVSRQASSNYGVGYDGRIGMYVEEKNRSWCSSSGANDQRAITIEIASDTFYPYAIKDAAAEAAIKLMADICIRNGKDTLVWKGSKEAALSYSDNGQKSNEMLITFHKWFANTACPGAYIENHIAEWVAGVNKILSGGEVKPTVTLFDEAQKMITESINGQARKNQAVTDGFKAEDVQAQIDLMLYKDKSAVIQSMLSVMPVVQSGSTGEAVRFLQHELKRAGYYTGDVDSIAGSATITAIKALQTNWNKVYGTFAVDGYFGPACWKKLLIG